MNAKEKAPTSAATLAEAATETAAFGGATISYDYLTTTAAGRQRKVSDFLSHGRENAVPLRHLKKMMETDGRTVRLMIQQERLSGMPICADNLTGYYTDKHLPGIGISIGLTRLFSQLLACGLIAPASYSGARVLVIPMDSTVLPFAAAAATELRGAGIATDVYYGDGGMKKKMKYAGKCGVPYVAIIGEAEAAEKTVALRDMRQSEQHSVSVTQAIEILKNSEI